MQTFPNLYPQDKPTTIQKSRLSYKNGKWRVSIPGGKERTASGVYNFVIQKGIIWVARANARVNSTLIGHVDLACGQDVNYAGRLYFSGRRNRGILRKWTNESGHYRPAANYHSQASLPSSLFKSI